MSVLNVSDNFYIIVSFTSVDFVSPSADLNLSHYLLTDSATKIITFITMSLLLARSKCGITKDWFGSTYS